MNSYQATPKLSHSTREASRASRDARALDTRRRITEAAMALAADGDVATVTSIVRAAGVSRASFYTHFESLTDLAFEMQRDAFVAIHEAALPEVLTAPEASLDRAQRALVEHYSANRTLYATAFVMPQPGLLQAAVGDALAEVVLGRIDALGGVPDGVDARMVATYIGHGAAGLLATWVTADDPVAPEVVVRHLADLLPPWVRTPARQSP